MKPYTITNKTQSPISVPSLYIASAEHHQCHPSYQCLKIPLSFLILSLIALFSTIPAHAQISGNWRTLTEQDGLASNRVLAMAEGQPDVYGVPAIWFGTDRGLSYFNGREWVNICRTDICLSTAQRNLVSAYQTDELAHDQINALLVDPNGVLWVGSEGGLDRFDFAGTIHRGQRDRDDDVTAHFDMNSGALSHNRVQALAHTATGVLWVGTANGVARYDGTGWQQFTPTNSKLPHADIRDILVADDGTVWLATAEGVIHYQAGAFTEIDFSETELFRRSSASDPTTSPTPTPFTSIIQDHDGVIWMATADQGIHRLDREGHWLEPVRTGCCLATNTVRDLAVDLEGRVWAATDRGMSYWDGVRWQRIFELQNESLSTYEVQMLLVTVEGTLWSAIWEQIDGYGVIALDGSWTTYQPANTGIATKFKLSSNNIYSVWVDGETVWVGTSGGISVSRDGGKHWQTWTTANGLGDNDVTSVWADGDTIWVGTERGGVSMSRDGGERWHTWTAANGLGSNRITSVWAGGDTVWIGTEGGGVSVSRDNGSRWQTWTTANGLDSNYVTSVWADGNTIWAGTGDRFFDGGGINVSRDGGQTWITVNQRDIYVSSIWADGDTVWVGTGNSNGLFGTGRGVSVSRDGGDRWHTWTTKDGLGSNNVTSVWVDGDTVWVGTENGMSVSRDGGERWQTWTTANGLGYDQVSSVWADGDTVWIGTGSSSLRRGGGLRVSQDGGEHWQIWTTTNYGLGSNNITSVWADDDTVWVGTSSGVSMSRDGGESWQTWTTANGLNSNDITALQVDGDTVWVSTSSGMSVSRDSGRSWQPWTTANGLGYRDVTSVWVDGDTVWIGTSGGVSVSRDGGERWRTWTAANGLGSNFINSIWADGDTVWIGTKGGGVSVSLDGGEGWQTWTTANGLESNFVNSVWSDGDTVWVGTSNGLTRYQTQRSEAWVRLEPIQTAEIGAVDNRGQVTTIHQGVPQIGDTIKLLDIQELSLQFLGGSFMNPVDDLTYFYQLSHYDEEPRQTNLGTGIGSSGDYVGLTYDTPYEFQLEVVDGEGRRSSVQRWPILVQTSPMIQIAEVTMNSLEMPAQITQIDDTLMSVSITLPTMLEDVPVTLNLNSYDPDQLDQPHDYEIVMSGRSITTTSVAYNLVQFILPLGGSEENPEDINVALVENSIQIISIDANGNRSQPVQMQFQTTLAMPPADLSTLLFNTALGLLLGLTGYIILVYRFVARPSNLPLTLVLNPTRIIPVLQGYSGFAAAVSTQGPLAQLTTLTLPLEQPITIPDVRDRLERHGIPTSLEDIRDALSQLVQQRVLTQEGEYYRFVQTLLPTIHRQAVGPAEVDRLTRRARTENPVYSTALRYFRAAGLDIHEETQGAMLLTAKRAYDRNHFGPTVYTQLIMGRAVQAAHIRAVEREAQQAYDGDIQDRIAFVVVDRTPETDARFQIYTCREESGFTVIPLGHGLLRQALLEDQASEMLHEQVSLYLGESDLYAANEPVIDTLSFFGRGPLINNIVDRFNRGQHVGLFGLRKLGKTSLLKQLPERLPNHVVAEIDVQNLGTDNIGPLCGDMIRAWVRDVQDRYPSLVLPKLEILETNFFGENSVSDNETVVELFRRDLLALYESVSAREGQVRFVLLLDEAERMLPSPSGRQAGFEGYERLLAVLRGVAQQENFLTLLVASVDPRLNRTDRWSDVDNPMYRFFQEFFLPPFTETECGEMVTNIGQQMGIDYTAEALVRIYAETGGHPFLTRSLCSLIIKDRPRPLTVDVAEVGEAVESFVYQPDSYLESLWDERLDGEEQALLRRLAAEGPLTRAMLVEGEERPRAMNQRLGTLVEHHLLRETDDGYEIGFALFRRWICYQELGIELGR